MKNDETLVAGPDTNPGGARAAAGAAGSSGYDLGDVIGRGGMGEVMLARDRRLGRDVAIKRMLRLDPDLVTRFLREARIQARLDHPAIVPVHEAGEDSEGRPYFTMKRLTGVTLDKLIAAPDTKLQPMLRAFVDVCLAIELAHSKGVVHRDLKPTNIMLGDFGEVYVLDWGVARVLGSADEPADATTASEGETVAGELIGTPGYMAPEQVRAEQVGPAADVYALGCILFEILTREPLHPRGPAALDTTLAVAESPAYRRPELAIAPELDSACCDALQLDAAARPAAAALANRIQHYLDGDRDLERRRSLSSEQLARAQDALARGDRPFAMQCAGRALALDPESPDAAALVSQLMLEPPRQPPAELVAELAASDATEVRRHALGAAIAFLIVLPLFPIGIWNGIKSWPIAIGFGALSIVLAGLAALIVRRPVRSNAQMIGYLFANACFVGALGYLLGPLLLGPAVASVITMSLIFYPAFTTRSWIVVALMVLGWAAPLALEAIGVMESTWSVASGHFSMTSNGLVVNATTTPALVFALSATTICLAAVLGSIYVRGHRAAKHQLVTQAWHLRQLLPR